MSNPPEEHDHFVYGCFTRHRSPAGSGNNNNGRRGLFNLGQGGRTVLPPLHLPFRSSRSPAPDLFHSNSYMQQDPIQGHNDYNTYNHVGWPMNSNPQAGPHNQQSSYTSDPRYQQSPTSYPQFSSRSSAIPTLPHDSRTLPPLNAQTQGYTGTVMSGGNQVRAPTSGYPAQYGQFTGHASQSTPYQYPPAPDPRSLPPPVSHMTFDTSSGSMPRRSSMSVDRNVPSRLSVHGPMPYSRGPPIISPSSYTSESISAEPTIKKKRKRADAEQLKILNETYNRTAFPSTEERMELAKRLNMSARSVQIWFQNKRQAMRQSNRQASSSAPPTTSEPFPVSSHAINTPPAVPLPSGGGYNHGLHMSGINAAALPGQGYGVPSRPTGDMPNLHYSGSRVAPSPTPSIHHRARSHDDDDRDPRRYSGRPY